jgi:outer membrane protein OmpA-like peptidoglycan-associated protein
MAVQLTGKFPIGATAGGTEDFDMRLDLTGGRELGRGLDLSAAVGYVYRGDPEEFRLVDSVLWGIAGAFPSRSAFRGVLEVHGETATSSEITTVGALVAEDGSVAPIDSRTKSTYRARGGAVWQPQGGFFIVAGASYTLGLADNIAGRAVSRHPWGADVQIGFRQSARRLAAPIQPPAAPPAPAAAVAPPAVVAAAPPAPTPAPAPRPAPPAAPASPAPRAALTFDEVHFDFDRSDIRPDDRVRLTEAARILRDNPDARVTIEGHADELGTAEYNLALGERRARSVYDYLVGLGVTSGRLSTVSYGEDSPRYDRQSGQMELNRRAALVVVP